MMPPPTQIIAAVPTIAKRAEHVGHGDDEAAAEQARPARVARVLGLIRVSPRPVSSALTMRATAP